MEVTKLDIAAGRNLECRLGRTTRPGLFTLELFHRDWAIPLGVIWYEFNSTSSIYIAGIHVHESFRRLGLATLMQGKLLEEFYTSIDVLHTGTGTKSGKAWMRATGWKEGEFHWQYRHRRAQPKRVAKKRA